MKWFRKRAARPVERLSDVASPAPSMDAADEGTRIERNYFVLNLPFAWSEEPSDEPLEFEFRNQTLPEQIIVTVLCNRGPIVAEELRAIVDRLVRIRSRCYEELSQGKAVVGPVTFQAARGQVEARCFGFDTANVVRFAWVIRASQRYVVTVALTRYYLPELGTPFEAYAGVIFDLLEIKDDHP